MAKKKQKEAKMAKPAKSKKAGKSLMDQLKELPSSPAFRFLIIFAAIIAVFYLIYYSSFFEKNFLDPYVAFLAMLSSGIMNIFGAGTSVQADVVRGSEFAISIKNGCDGVEVMVYFLAAVLAFPVTMRYKVPGLIVGILSLVALNIFRIIGLYQVGVHKHEWFDFLHLHGGFVIFTAVGILVWFAWVNWVVLKMRAESDVAV